MQDIKVGDIVKRDFSFYPYVEYHDNFIRYCALHEINKDGYFKVLERYRFNDSAEAVAVLLKRGNEGYDYIWRSDLDSFKKISSGEITPSKLRKFLKRV